MKAIYVHLAKNKAIALEGGQITYLQIWPKLIFDQKAYQLSGDRLQIDVKSESEIWLNHEFDWDIVTISPDNQISITTTRAVA